METIKFKTSINCGGCVANVTPHLNQVKGIGKWSVDTSNPMKILTVETDSIHPEEVIETLKKAGYRADQIITE